MKTKLLATATAMMLSTTAMAENIGVSMALFDDNFLTVLRNGIQEMADGMDGVDVQIEDAQNDVARQLDQINNFVASGVDAIIVNPVDTSATQAMTDAAAAAGVPLVYVNRQPINVDTLPDNQAFVASNEIESGTLESFEICKILRSQGKGGGAKAYLMMGELSNQAAVQRTKDVDDVLGMDMCNFIEIIDRQTANWSREQANSLMTNWLSSGEEFDAVFANNDEMAIGIIRAAKRYEIDIPSEMKLVGFDNIRMAELMIPSLTTVTHEKEGMGELAASTLINALDEKAKESKALTILPTSLILRETL